MESSNAANHHHEEEEHEEHIDERWLVSYADMMTLLFGLFVVLFSIADEKKGKFTEMLQEISQATTKDENNKTIKDIQPLVAKAEPIPAPPAPPPPEKIEEPPQKENLEKINALELEVKKNLEEKEKIQADSQAKILENEDLKEKLNEALKIKEDLEKKISQMPPPPTDLKISEVDFKNLENEKSNLQEERAKLLKKNAELIKKIDTFTKKIAEKDTAPQGIDPLIFEKLEQEKKQIEEEKVSLLRELEDFRKSAALEKEFLLVVFKWSTEKHDIDITVEDPNGKKFDFKNRKYSNHPGELTLDSRGGPGAEIWQSDKVIPGVYKVQWKLYNPYGNTSPVAFEGFVSSHKGKILIPSGSLEAKVGQKGSFHFTINEKGHLIKSK